jgi:hypothetical protein
VRTYTVYLTSTQISGVPITSDSYSFSGFPGSPTVLSSYSVIADGSDFSKYNVYSNTLNDGSFFPWRNIITTYITNLPSIELKGPYSIVFCTSGLDTSYYKILKIIYDFNDGTTRSVDHPAGATFGGKALLASPNNINVSNIYYPRDYDGTTYTPSITVVNGDLVSNIFNISLTFHPGSIYDFNNIHLLNSTSIGVSSDALLNIYETKSPNYVTHALMLSA